MENKAPERAAMPQGTSVVLDSRTLHDSYASLLPILKSGMRVLDVGCGTGAISAGIAAAVGPNGHVTGIDSSEHLIRKGQTDHTAVSNLELVVADLFTYEPAEKFDLIVSARVLQWLNNPAAALEKFRQLLRPGGQISILDYNHEQLRWHPAPPASMQAFYRAFLNWRADAGMDNEIADHLPALFENLGFHHIRQIPADEVYKKNDANFEEKAGIWAVVAELRGPQVVQNGFITEEERLRAITDYQAWVRNGALSMTMKLKDIQATV